MLTICQDVLSSSKVVDIACTEEPNYGCSQYSVLLRLHGGEVSSEVEDGNIFGLQFVTLSGTVKWLH